MRSKIWKSIIAIFTVIAFIAIVLTAILFKGLNKYRPSIYNYESYLSPNIITKLKKEYNYKEFKEISEFSQALNQEKAIAGVGSDFQAGQLIIDKKIKKINFEKIYGVGTNNWNLRKNFYTPNVIEHIEELDNMVLLNIEEKKKNNEKVGFWSDGKNYLSLPKGIYADSENINEYVEKLKEENFKKYGDPYDHFYDYILPYYSQDKGFAYNINETTRPNLNIESVKKQLEDQSEKLSWIEIANILKNNNYKHFGWTNAYIDNLMIGAITYGENWKEIFTKKVNGKDLFNFNNDNYKLAIDSFNKFVKYASGASIRDTQYNFFSSDGLELLNFLIEPKTGRSDVAIVYNGDALDAYYSSDNFSSVEEGKIRFIRPKNNYILMDNWILSNGLSEKDSDAFLETLKDLVYQLNPSVNQYINALLFEDSLLHFKDKKWSNYLKSYIVSQMTIALEKDKTLSEKLEQILKDINTNKNYDEDNKIAKIDSVLNLFNIDINTIKLIENNNFDVNKSKISIFNSIANLSSLQLNELTTKMHEINNLIKDPLLLIEDEFFKEFKEIIDENSETLEENKELFNKQVELFKNDQEFIETLSQKTNQKITSENFVSYNQSMFERFLDNPRNPQNYNWFLVWRDGAYGDGQDEETNLFSEIFEDLFTESSIAEISNFDYISYTPTDLMTYEFIKKWYFAGDEQAIAIYQQPEPNNEYKVYSYPFIDNNLRTKIASYYFETTKS
ncbi:hypothetical protein FJO69_01070 [[Mycoplasma] falconis]|uniref:Uncharacterized protein n=1 Tax=[Mycoplasma] falconis TaxID=92403 RepID=A0A501XB10_9BACT|nr:hypothetical protein [[Mycoplasma] falconis]TPE57775.1 hypothetical protein FJO69_01070 [[Mycoplasma] falconis]